DGAASIAGCARQHYSVEDLWNRKRTRNAGCGCPAGRSTPDACGTHAETGRARSRSGRDDPGNPDTATMAMIDKDHVEALIDLERIAHAHGIVVVMIGAGARLLLLDWKYHLPVRRTSEDWDFATRVRSWNQFERFRDALTTGEKSPFRRTPAEHRL